MNEQRNWFLEMESTPGKDAVKTAEMTTKDLAHYINLAHKAGFKRIDSNFERNFTMGKMLSNSIDAAEKSFLKEESIDAANFTVVLF